MGYKYITCGSKSDNIVFEEKYNSIKLVQKLIQKSWNDYREIILSTTHFMGSQLICDKTKCVNF